MNKIFKFVTVAGSANDADVSNYVAVDAIHHFSTTDASVIVNVIGAGANVSALDTITIELSTAAEIHACANKLAQLMTAVNVTKATPIVVDVNFSAGITDITYAAV
jgi:hypothetical protein